MRMCRSMAQVPETIANNRQSSSFRVYFIVMMYLMTYMRDEYINVAFPRA